MLTEHEAFAQFTTGVFVTTDDSDSVVYVVIDIKSLACIRSKFCISLIR